ncbi:MAG: shikimate kinase, partial [Solirubrobacteraceae bacterium]
MSGAAAAGDGRAVAMVGFMGAGKSTAARSAARALGGEPVDVDAVIEHRLGATIGAIFARDGEAAFRAAEERITLELLEAPSDGPRPVVALGGGALGSAAVRDALRDHLTVWIDVDLDTAWRRCEGTARPLAADRDAFTALYTARRPVYEQAADVVVPQERAGEMGAVLAALEGVPRTGVTVLWATSASGDYPAYIGPGLLSGPPFWPATVAGRRFVVTDYNVGRLYGEALGRLDGRVTIMPGEQSKTIAHAEIV